MKHKIFALLILCLFFNGCATKELFRQFLGTSTKALEKAKSQGVSKIYNYKKDACFKGILAVLKNMDAYVYVKNEQESVIKVMDLRKNLYSDTKEIDTTELGIFFEKQDLNKTKITITSLSSILLNEYSQKIFDNLDKELKKK